MYLPPTRRLLVTMNRSQRGASTVEYALLVVGIAALLVMAFAFKEVIGAVFLDNATEIGCVTKTDGTKVGDSC